MHADSIHVGMETVIDSQQFAIHDEPQDSAALLMKNEVHALTQPDDDGLTDRALKPKYSHRKNTQHLLKAGRKDRAIFEGSNAISHGGISTQ